MEEISQKEIKEFQAGKKQVFNRIMAIYKDRVAGLCFKYMNNMEEARDMSQEIFCAAYTNIKSFEFRSKFSTWLYRLAVNHCISRLRMLKSRMLFQDRPSGKDEYDNKAEMESIGDENRLQDEEMEMKELADMTIKELAKFPCRERTILLLLDMESLSCREISGILKIPVGTVKVIAARTRHKLKKIILKKIR
jgi:RNA polymerase sigma-70 factor (ECF subfamily)